MSKIQFDSEAVVNYLNDMTHMVVEERVVRLIDDIDKALERFGCPDMSRVVNFNSGSWFNEAKLNILRTMISESPSSNLPNWIWIQSQVEVLSGIENQLSHNPEPDLNKYSPFISETCIEVDFKFELEQEDRETEKLHIKGGVGNIPGCINNFSIIISSIEVEGLESTRTFSVEEWKKIKTAMKEEYVRVKKEISERLKAAE